MRPEEPVARIMTEAVVVIEIDRPVSEALDCFGTTRSITCPSSATSAWSGRRVPPT